MDALSILALAKVCSQGVPAVFIASLSLAETGGTPYYVNISGESTVYQTMDKAIQAVTIADANSEIVFFGIARVPYSEIKNRKITLTDGFSPCRNLQVASEIVAQEWNTLGKTDKNLPRAITAYAVGHPDAGEAGNFTGRFTKSLTETKALEAFFRNPVAVSVPSPTTTTTEASPQPQAVGARGRSFNPFDRSSLKSSILVFSKSAKE